MEHYLIIYQLYIIILWHSVGFNNPFIFQLKIFEFNGTTYTLINSLINSCKHQQQAENVVKSINYLLVWFSKADGEISYYVLNF